MNRIAAAEPFHPNHRSGAKSLLVKIQAGEEVIETGLLMRNFKCLVQEATRIYNRHVVSISADVDAN